MPVLSVHHYESSGGRLADLAWKGQEDIQATVRFAPQLDRFDLEDIRWYHENYRQNWRVSSNSVIQRIQRAELNIGKALHAGLFHSDAFLLAQKVRRAAPELRIEIRDEIHSAAVPWELIADPETGQKLALASSTFVRGVGGERDVSAQNVFRAENRLLLVISRPGGVADIGYWSVAYELWQELARLLSVKVDVLRPPTFDTLERRLAEVAESGTPYAAVHFDGHGTILDPFGGNRTRGYLLFETAGGAGPEFIDGATIGRVLAAARVLHFSMNACRSADSRGGDRHLRAEPELAVGQPSIVEDVLAEGVASCIGMRREIYPGTATRFFCAFYPEFFGGRSAGEAARIARSRLHEEPLAAKTLQEDIAPVDDWSIPVVGERTAVRLQKATHRGRGKKGAEQASTWFPEHLSAPPVVGFDRAVLALEGMLAEGSVVLVHGPLLSGKSRLAVEYAKWLASTSTIPCPVHFVRLCASDTPSTVAARMLSKTSDGPAPVDTVECAGHLNSRGGVLILDQADRLAPETGAFLSDILCRLEGTCRVIVTARAESLPWLPRCRSVIPDALFRRARAELGRRWMKSKRARFELAKVHALLFFSGGLPGMILLLLGAAHKLISRGKASAEDIASWLHSGNWDKIADLTRDPGPGLPSIEDLIGRAVEDLSSICNEVELATIRVLCRFHVCCDEVSAARLIAAISGTALSVEAVSRVMGKLAATGLATRVVGAAEPVWFLHSMLKLVASRLDQATDADDDGPQGAVIDTVSRKCADLAVRFRRDTVGAVDMLELYKQNISDALNMALEREQLEAASHLTEGLCLYCRFVGDVDLASGVLDRALPYFINTRTGELRPECREIGLKVWDQAIWLAPDWPRKLNAMGHGRVRLIPPDEDHYAAGLWLRAIGRMDQAAVAFRMELDAPALRPRYASGDIECHLSETVYNPHEPRTWPDALRESLRSYAARLRDDSLGRAWSRISEARIRLVTVLNRECYWVSDDDVTARIELLPEDLAALNEIAELLRDAQSEAGGQSAENRAEAAMIWSRIMLGRGDLTSAISYFEDGAEIKIAMEEASIWHHYWAFALNLLRHGWVARSYETAVNAFQFAMQTGNIMLPTRIREFCERLETTYSELNS